MQDGLERVPSVSSRRDWGIWVCPFVTSRHLSDAKRANDTARSQARRGRSVASRQMRVVNVHLPRDPKFAPGFAPGSALP